MRHSTCWVAACHPAVLQPCAAQQAQPHPPEQQLDLLLVHRLDHEAVVVGDEEHAEVGRWGGNGGQVAGG